MPLALVLAVNWLFAEHSSGIPKGGVVERWGWQPSVTCKMEVQLDFKLSGKYLMSGTLTRHRGKLLLAMLPRPRLAGTMAKSIFSAIKIHFVDIWLTSWFEKLLRGFEKLCFSDVFDSLIWADFTS